jgi:DNA-binding transcriptional LysR family regulator
MQLEDQIGFTLFDRSRIGIMLTSEGREFYEAAHAIVEASEQVHRRVEEIAQRRRHVVRVGVSYSSFAAPSRRRLLSRYGEIRTSTELDCEACPFTPEVIDRVLDGTFDFGICFGPVETPDVDVCVLQDIDMKLAVPVESPLADKRAIALADLKGCKVVVGLKNIKADLHNHAYSWIDQVGAELRHVNEGRRYVFDVAERERGIFVCYTDADKIPESFVCRPIVGPRPYLNLSLVRYRRVLSNAAERFWRLAHEIAAEDAAARNKEEARIC